MTRRRLLWIGDAGCETGFARSTHNIVPRLQRDWDVHVMGIGFSGDPVPSHPFPIWPAHTSGDLMGVRRVKEMLERLRPDCVVIQNDPWNFPAYYQHIPEDMPMIGVVAVDGHNCRGLALNRLRLAVFWTDFAREQARLGGCCCPAAVIPLGVDSAFYTPGDRREARAALELPEDVFVDGGLLSPADAFIVGSVGRNQLRKRLDLTISYFSEWVSRYDVRDALLYIHTAPTPDDAFGLVQLADFFGVRDRMIVCAPEILRGSPEERLRDTYRAFDVYLSTTQGEGWGLTAMEAMACGVPCVLPDWAAYGEWAQGAARLVPCTTVAVTPNKINSIGGVPDREFTIDTLEMLYRNRKVARQVGEAGLRLAAAAEYRWSEIAERFAQEVLRAVPDLQPEREAVTA